MFLRDLQGIDKTDAKEKGSYPRLMALTWDTVSSALHASLFMLRGNVGARDDFPLED